MNFSASDHQMMARALRLARRGLYSTDPNPRVGCVIARNGEIVGQGWHLKAGTPHAEIHALNDAGEKAHGATAYVTLEPCSHHGRTPPCAQALVDAGVARVVFAVRDPNPLVDGSGMSLLESAGIECTGGLMEAPASELNIGFFKRQATGRPFVRLKSAQSLDGRTALASGESQWITGRAAREDGQRWRARASAIMTGIGTVLADDPSMNVRLEGAQRQPVRIVVDSHWRTPAEARLLSLPGDVIIAGCEDATVPDHLAQSQARLLPLPAHKGRVDLEALLSALADLEMNEVHVEAGPILGGALLGAGLVDELIIYLASCLLGSDARPAFEMNGPERLQDCLRFDKAERVSLGSDLRIRLTPQYCKG